MNNILDIGIYETGSGGDWNLKNDDIELVSGLANQVYLALFGGNFQENTSEELDESQIREDWWGNFLLEEEELQFNSNFERALSEVALTSNGLSILEEAAKSDLKYLEKYADIEIELFITGITRLQLNVTLTEPDNKSTKVTFLWDSAKNEIIQDIII